MYMYIVNVQSHVKLHCPIYNYKMYVYIMHIIITHLDTKYGTHEHCNRAVPNTVYLSTVITVHFKL